MLTTVWSEFGLDPSTAEADCSALGNLKGKVLKDKDVVNAVLFLASDEAAYVSGQNLVVDGGFTVVNHSLSIYK
ncbi:hypothetical protein SUGI_1126660 [Cryptomeria japonica]|nr:hypothetical protein SUGI_1126660 [Cryptomeria japonica]